jgi:peptide/nickel transport system ATP-binding protein
MAADPLLLVENLSVDYLVPSGAVRAVDQVNLQIHAGEIVGLVGESGSGKSTVAQAVMRTLGAPALITGGRIHFDGRDVLAMPEGKLRALRWNEISMVMQSALNALNPVMTVYQHVADTLRAHRSLSRRQTRERAAELMSLVDIDPRHLSSYPHELSGGMRQRVVIALALALEPRLLIFDEPTTALDVVVEREILRRVFELQTELGFAILFITHDLSLLLQFAGRVGVLYAGRMAELAPVEGLGDGGRHPYSQGLLGAIPRLRGDREQTRSIPGSPPSLLDPPSGCRFHPRCGLAEERCSAERPALVDLGRGHSAACHLVRP